MCASNQDWRPAWGLLYGTAFTHLFRDERSPQLNPGDKRLDLRNPSQLFASS